jgi:UDP-glucose 4-epimerase
MTKKVLLTGANGFIGRRMVDYLRLHGWDITAATRNWSESFADGVRVVMVGDLSQATQWSEALRGVTAVVHLAGRAHRVGETGESVRELYMNENALASEHLARQAATAGVRRFIIMSTLMTLGQSSPPGGAFTDDADPNPADVYAQSKLEAERRVSAIAAQTGMEWAALRPPLVYGPGVKANMGRLITAVKTKRFLPLPSNGATRSYLFVDNLCDATLCLLNAPHVNGAYLVADAEAVTLPELVTHIAKSSGRYPFVIPLPSAILGLAAYAGDVLARLGYTSPYNSAIHLRLAASLKVDTIRIRSELGWTPPFSLAEGIARSCH